jgi:hypothetical protein
MLKNTTSLAHKSSQPSQKSNKSNKSAQKVPKKLLKKSTLSAQTRSNSSIHTIVSNLSLSTSNTQLVHTSHHIGSQTHSKNPQNTPKRHYFVDPLAPTANPTHQHRSPQSPRSTESTELYSRTPNLKGSKTTTKPIPAHKLSPNGLKIEPPTAETTEIVESIEDYNKWLGNKMSQPVLQALQTIFVTNGIAKIPKSISTTTPREHILETLLQHGIIVPQSYQFESLVPKEQIDIKQPYVVEFLKTLRFFNLFSTDLLDKYKPGFINPNIPFKPGRTSTNQFDKSLEVQSDENNGKNKITTKRTITIIDAMVDSLRLSGAFDVHSINPKTLKSKLGGVLPPPTGEDQKTNFDHISLTQYDQNVLKDHECTQHSIAWYQQSLKNETNITNIQKLHAKYYRYDVSFAFRSKFGSIYDKVINFDQELLIEQHPEMNIDELINKYAPTKSELQLFKSLVYDEHIQTRFYQYFVKTPKQNEFISVQNQSYETIVLAQRNLRRKEHQNVANLFSSLNTIASKEDYPMLNDDNGGDDDSDDRTKNDNNNEQNDTTQNGKKLNKQKIVHMILPPEENLKTTTTKKLFYLLIADSLIPPPSDGYPGTMQEYIMDSLVKLNILRKLPQDQPDARLVVPLVPHPDHEDQFVEIDTEELELLDLLYDLELVPTHSLGRYIPARDTPLLLNSDSSIQQELKLSLLHLMTPLVEKKIQVPVKKVKKGENGEEIVLEELEEQFIQRRQIPLVRRIIDTIIDAQEIDLENQDSVDGLIGNTLNQIDTTWPRFVHLDDTEADNNNNNNNNNNSQVDGNGQNNTTPKEFVFQSEFLEMKPFKRTPDNDAKVSMEIQAFDHLLSNLDIKENFSQIQAFLIQFYRHDICLDFAQKNPALFKKLIVPEQIEYKTHLKLQKSGKERVNTEDDLLVDFVPPTFNKDEIDNIRWLISNLHVQFHLVQKYKSSRNQFHQMVQSGEKSGQIVKKLPKIQFEHVLIGDEGMNNETVKQTYFNQVWGGNGEKM